MLEGNIYHLPHHTHNKQQQRRVTNLRLISNYLKTEREYSKYQQRKKTAKIQRMLRPSAYDGKVKRTPYLQKLIKQLFAGQKQKKMMLQKQRETICKRRNCLDPMQYYYIK